ncbi:MAG TPA: SRPBCC family protein [Polyangiaceae bacterium]|nr:SRPBCC family protein [Polyangiaceae bacterium]
MSHRAKYVPGPAALARVEKDGERWTLVLARELRHPPALVWQALTDPAQLAEWAPFDADRNLGTKGPVKLTAIGAPTPTVAESEVTRAEREKVLEFVWGGNLRWELEPTSNGTRLTLWHNIDSRFISWGAAGWHVCFDVLDGLLAGEPIGRLAGPAAMKVEGWQRLASDYGKQFAAEMGGPEAKAPPG